MATMAALGCDQPDAALSTVQSGACEGPNAAYYDRIVLDLKRP